MSDLMLDVDQAGELKAAFRRGNWTNAEIKRACEGDFLARARQVLLGFSEIKPLEHAKAVAVEVTGVKIYPADGEVFELILDGDASENDPLEMVRRDGYGDSEKWRHNGRKVTGYQTRRFQLVSIGYCGDWDEVTKKLVKHGRIPEGQFRNAFKATFPTPDGKGPVGVADSSWVRPVGRASFPYVSTGGYSSFDWTERGFGDDWRWLVEVGTSTKA